MIKSNICARGYGMRPGSAAFVCRYEFLLPENLLALDLHNDQWPSLPILIIEEMT
jgi:hypothetical protein